MGKAIRRKKPSVPQAPWDAGPLTRAQIRGKVIEEAVEIDPKTGKPEPNPNGIMRTRRRDMLEIYFKRGTISPEGYEAGCKLRDAFEGTQRSTNGLTQVKVDCSPNPGHAIDIQLKRMARFREVARHIPQADRQILFDVVVMQNGPSGARGRKRMAELARLREALDRLAERLGVG